MRGASDAKGIFAKSVVQSCSVTTVAQGANTVITPRERCLMMKTAGKDIIFAFSVSMIASMNVTVVDGTAVSCATHIMSVEPKIVARGVAMAVTLIARKRLSRSVRRATSYFATAVEGVCITRHGNVLFVE